MMAAALAVVALSCSRESATVSNQTFFAGARLIPGDGSPAIERSAILVADGRIVAVGTFDELAAPRGVTTIDLSGKTIVPLLVTLHTRPGYARGVSFSEENYNRETYVNQLDTFLYYGLGAVVSMGVDRGQLAFQLREEQRQGELGGTRLFTAGRGLAAPDAGPQFPALKPVPRFVETAEDVRTRVADLAEMGVDMIKIWVDDRNDRVSKLSPELFGAIINEAHQHGIQVMAHVYELSDAKELVRAGVDGFAHLVRDHEVDDELVQLILDNDVFIVSNLNVQAHPDKNRTLDDPFLHETISAELIAELRAAQGDGGTVSERAVEIYRNMEKSLAKLSKAGARIAFGSDSGIPRNFVGFSEHRELELMVDAGMAPMEVIQAATSTSAEILGLTDSGSLTVGKLADFIVLNENPLDDIRNTRTIDSLYRNGKKLDRASLRH